MRGQAPPDNQLIMMKTAGRDGTCRKWQDELAKVGLVFFETDRETRGRHFHLTRQSCGRKLVAEAKGVGVHSETGMNCRTHAPNPPGFRLWMYTTPGPRNRHTNPSPEVKLATHPAAARSML